MQEGVGYGAAHQAERAPDVVERLVKQLLVGDLVAGPHDKPIISPG